MRNTSGISSRQETLAKRTVPVECSVLIDFQAEGVLWIKMGIKLLLFGTWENYMSCGAHNFLRLSYRPFKKYC